VPQLSGLFIPIRLYNAAYLFTPRIKNTKDAAIAVRIDAFSGNGADPVPGATERGIKGVYDV